MSSTTNSTTTAATTEPHEPAGGSQRARSGRAKDRTGEHVTAVQIGAWGPQECHVRASSGGGRGGAPYGAVTIGSCLFYIYDRGALDSHLLAWQAAHKDHQGGPTAGVRANSGADVGVVSHVLAEQRHAVVASTWADGRP